MKSQGIVRLEIAYQKALLQQPTDQELIKEYWAFHKQQKTQAGQVLGKLYRKSRQNIDGKVMLEACQYLKQLHRACRMLEGTAQEESVQEEERQLLAEFSAGDRVKAGKQLLQQEMERCARLILYLAGVVGQQLLLQELVLLPETVWQQWLELDQERKHQTRATVHGRAPLVSIMIPTYNMPDIFERTMRSAAIQTYSNLEIIVCDNSTNDQTQRIMEGYREDKRVRYIRNKAAKTKAENFHTFQSLAKGEYLQWLMHDDILLPDKVEKMAHCLTTMPDVTLVTSQRGIIDADGIVHTSRLQTGFPIEGEYQVFESDVIARTMFYYVGNILGEPSAVLFRRQDLTNHYWNADSRGYKVLSDVAMWLELLEKGKCVLYKEPLSYYRRHAGQEGQQIDVVLLSRLEWVRLAQDYLKKNCFITEQDYVRVIQVLLKDYESLLKKKDIASAGMWARYSACIERTRLFYEKMSKER